MKRLPPSVQTRELLRRILAEGTLGDPTDRGKQYACASYQKLMDENKMTVSMSRPKDPYNNTPVESFFATLKRNSSIRRGRTPAQTAWPLHHG